MIAMTFAFFGSRKTSAFVPMDTSGVRSNSNWLLTMAFADNFSLTHDVRNVFNVSWRCSMN